MQPRITARPLGAHVTITVVGGLDAATNAELRTFLLKALDQGWVCLVVDLTSTERFDAEAEAEAEAMFVHIAHLAHNQGGCCHLVPPDQLTAQGELLPGCLLGHEAATPLAAATPDASIAALEARKPEAEVR